MYNGRTIRQELDFYKFDWDNGKIIKFCGDSQLIHYRSKPISNEYISKDDPILDKEYCCRPMSIPLPDVPLVIAQDSFAYYFPIIALHALTYIKIYLDHEYYKDNFKVLGI